MQMAWQMDKLSEAAICNSNTVYQNTDSKMSYAVGVSDKEM